MSLTGSFFITGTDTEIGKTWVSCRLLEQAAAEGKSSYGLKPLAAGAEEVDGKWCNEDALALTAASSMKLDYDMVNPVLLKSATAPHIAAQQEGKRLQSSRLAGYVKGTMMSRKADLVLVEGAGGWLVPLNDRETMQHLALELDLPVLLVVGMKLGCINHALLSAQVIKASGAKFAGWVANDLGQPMLNLAQNVRTLDAMMPGPRLRLPGQTL